MTLQKSRSEYKADVLLQVIKRGRASARQAAVLLDMAKETMVKRIRKGAIRAVQLETGRYYVTLAELQRCGLALPTNIPELAPLITHHLTNDPTRDVNHV